eukprot:403341009
MLSEISDLKKIIQKYEGLIGKYKDQNDKLKSACSQRKNQVKQLLKQVDRQYAQIEEFKNILKTKNVSFNLDQQDDSEQLSSIERSLIMKNVEDEVETFRDGTHNNNQSSKFLDRQIHQKSLTALSNLKKEVDQFQHEKQITPIIKHKRNQSSSSYNQQPNEYEFQDPHKQQYTSRYRNEYGQEKPQNYKISSQYNMQGNSTTKSVQNASFSKQISRNYSQAQQKFENTYLQPYEQESYLNTNRANYINTKDTRQTHDQRNSHSKDISAQSKSIIQKQKPSYENNNNSGSNSHKANDITKYSTKEYTSQNYNDLNIDHQPHNTHKKNLYQFKDILKGHQSNRNSYHNNMENHCIANQSSKDYKYQTNYENSYSMKSHQRHASAGDAQDFHKNDYQSKIIAGHRTSNHKLGIGEV